MAEGHPGQVDAASLAPGNSIQKEVLTRQAHVPMPDDLHNQPPFALFHQHLLLSPTYPPPLTLSLRSTSAGCTSRLMLLPGVSAAC